MKVILGSGVALLIIVLALLGYRNFGRSIAVPQVGDSRIEETEIQALPTGSALLGNKNNNAGMTPIQVIKKDSGLIIEIMEEGSLGQVRLGDIVTVDYRGYLTDGTVFDESYKRGQPFSFSVGAGQVIAGWDEGLLGMKVGEKRRLTIPANLGYGQGGIPGVIPANATLIFDVELRKIGQ